MAKAYFIKHGVNRRLTDKRGIQFPFQDIGDDTGLIEIDTELQADWHHQLKGVSGTLGILEVPPDQVEELKKKCSVRRQPLSSRPALRIDQPRRSVPPQPVAAPANAVAESDPIQIPETVTKRRPGRPRKVESDSLAPIVESATPKETEPVP
jgi:hypothetical protein